MLLDIFNMDPKPMAHFKGGEGEALVRMHADEMGKVAQITLPVGASIGYHTHEDSYEVIYVLSGCGTCYDGDQVYPVSAGMVQYCPQFAGHSIVNTGTEDLRLLGIIPNR
ncbi:MAG: cupin domain-containing protein [Ruminococcaceae bacterium]|nr:cupin domain-containing protein [Oscillospiraceae bacterium]